MLENPDVRWRQRLQSFRKAFAHLSKAAVTAQERKLSELEQQGLIQAFEFTHELAWNTLKDFLESRGATGLYGSKDVTREAFAKGLIQEGENWMAMIQSRNQTSHTYNEEIAAEIARAILSRYVPEFENLYPPIYRIGKQGTMKSDHGLSDQAVAKVIRVLACFPQVEKAVLFGSRAKATHKRGSDIDLALVGRGLNWLVVGKIDDALDDLLLPYRFSLVIFGEKTDAAVAAHIRRVGRTLFERELALA